MAKRPSRPPFAVCGSALFIVLAALTSAALGADIKFDNQGLTVTGLTPGGNVALCGVILQPLGYESRIVKVAKIMSADAGGSVSYATPWIDRSVWAVVDITSGSFAKGGSKHSRAKVTDTQQGSHPVGVGAARFASPGTYLVVMMVRPGGGVWALDVADGGPDDDDKTADSKVTVALNKLKPLGSGPAAPAVLAHGDALIAIDPYSLRAYTAQLQ